jgi:antitoxin component YwqK of YwqJK toxin-antitoxin module
MRIFIFILLILPGRFCPAQKGDTLVMYLDKNLAFTNKAGMVYPAIAFPQDNHWILKSTYPDGSILVEVHFLDKKLTVNDGQFIVNYAGNAHAARGVYHNNYRSGVWQSWYKNGQLKDSGALINDVLVGTWVTFYETGSMMTRVHFSDQIGSSGLSPLVNSEKNSLLEFPPIVAIKNGVMESWKENGLQKDSGNYQSDLKTGYWKEWYDNGKPESVGTYGANETLVGDWTFYRENGSVSTKEKYVNTKLTDLQCFDENGSPSGIFCSVAKPPVLLGTPYDWKLFFDTHLVWSRESLKSRREAVVTIRFFIGKDGKLTNHTITNSPSPFVTQDIEKVVGLMKEWSPAVLHNRPFEYSFDYQVNFYP